MEEEEISRRSVSILSIFTGESLAVSLPAVHCCISAVVLYSLVSMILINYFFEKTQSTEILYVFFFAASFSLEALRYVLPLGWVYETPSLYGLMASRIILFCRYFGIFSLFTTSIFAGGYRVQKQWYVILIITIITLIITLGVPIDTQVWDSSMNMLSGHGSMFKIIEIGAFFITIISFLIAAWSRSSRKFVYIGAGSALVLLGRNILLHSDTWAALPIGMLFLAIGTWLICAMLHRVYLWL